MRHIIFLMSALAVGLMLTTGCFRNNSTEIRTNSYIYHEIYSKQLPQLDSVLQVVSDMFVSPENKLTDGVFVVVIYSTDDITDININWYDNYEIDPAFIMGYRNVTGKCFLIGNSESETGDFDICFSNPTKSAEVIDSAIYEYKDGEYVLGTSQKCSWTFSNMDGNFKLTESYYIRDMRASRDSLMRCLSSHPCFNDDSKLYDSLPKK